MAGGENLGNSYTGPTNNIRETLKWLIAAFAAPVAIMIGTGPLAKLPPLGSTRLYIALAAGTAGVAMALTAIKFVSDIMVQPVFFLHELTRLDTPKKNERSGTSAAESGEIGEPELGHVYAVGAQRRRQHEARRRQLVGLEAYINAHQADLFPPPRTNLAEMIGRFDKAEQSLAVAGADDATSEENRRTVHKLGPVLLQITQLANFELLRRRFDETRHVLIILSLAGLISFGVFAWSIGGDSDAKGANVRVTCVTSPQVGRSKSGV